MRLLATIFSLTIMLFSTPAISGPLGVDFTTDTPETLGCRAVKVSNKYRCDTMPDQSWSLRDYWLSISDKGKICTITGHSAVIESGPDGAELRAAMDFLKDQIAQTCGEPKLVDGVFGRRPVDEDESWMAQVGAVKRLYLYGWSFDAPGDGASDMGLIARSNGVDEGSYQLQVNTTFAADCVALN